MLNSVRVRLTLWYVAILALVLLAFSLGVYGILARSLYTRLDSGLHAAVEGAVIALAREAAEGEDYQQAAIYTVEELFSPYHALAIFDTEGRLLREKAAQDNTRVQLPDAGPLPSDSPTIYTVAEQTKGADHRRRVVLQRVEIVSAGRSYFVVVSQ